MALDRRSPLFGPPKGALSFPGHEPAFPETVKIVKKVFQYLFHAELSAL
jgi:hypothetical protein